MNEEKLVELMKIHFPTKGEMSADFKGVDKQFEEVKEILEDLKASSKANDALLEAYPIERISRMETHLNLPRFVPAIAEE